MMTQNIAHFFTLDGFVLYPFSFWLTSLIVLLGLSFSIKLIYKERRGFNTYSEIFFSSARFFIDALTKPLFVFLIFYVIYLGLIIGNNYYSAYISANFLTSYDFFIEFITLFWCLLSALSLGKARLLNWLAVSNHNMIYIVFKMIGSSLQAIIFLMLLNTVLPQLGLTGLPVEFLEKTTRLLLIGVIGWIFLQLVNGIEELIVSRNTLENINNIHGRKINTQVRILKKVILCIGVFITLAAMLMVFDSVRDLGAGLLTTAGILGAAGAFASQRSLAGLFSGMHLAFTQPIRLGDTVIIENEFGQVEEITLSYVVIKLWDLRRLILPTDYFTTKGIVNLTRNSTELLGTIMFYVDYTLPIDTLRNKFMELLEQSPLWDKKIPSFQVTDLKEQTIELRAVISAKNSGDLWNLRCDLREKLLKFIVDNFPHALPRTRQSIEPSTAVLQKENTLSITNLAE